MKRFILKIFKPKLQEHWYADLVFAGVRFICGALLTLSFGSDKFGMPWSATGSEFGFLEVAAWFPEDVAKFGGLFALAPVFFAWMGAASEAIGGLFLALGLGTRISAFLIMCTMLVAIFFQKWGQGTWGMLPAMGFLWISLYNLYLGSGRFGIDYLITKRKSQ
jgi:putative oxidoreductase